MDMQEIHVFAKWQVKEGKLETVLNLLDEVISKSTAEKGNLFYRLHQDISDSNSLVLFEGYRDQAALETHRNSEHFQVTVIGKIIPLLENREVVLATELVPV